MKQFQEELVIKTTQVQTMTDVTQTVVKVLRDSGIEEGLLTLFVPHTTAAVTINENADPDVVSDMLAGLDKVFPIKGNYRHFEGNSHAHLKASCIGMDQSVIVEKGRMILGTWQGIYFCEFDGPRNRKLVVRIIGS